MSSNPEQMRMQARMAKGQAMKEEDKLFRYKGVLYPTIMSPLENLKAMEHLGARHDDVMLAAYPKSVHESAFYEDGVPPCRSMPHQLLMRSVTDVLCFLENLTEEGKYVFARFNWMTAVVRKIMAVSTGGEVGWGHPHIEFFDPEAQQMLVIIRNPKDTAVSFYHFSVKDPVLPTPESWDVFFSGFMSGDVPWGSYFDHALAWEKRIEDPNVMIVTYAEMKEDLSKGVQQISQFFGFPLSKEQIQTIAEDSTFSSMKEKSQVSHGILASSIIFRKGEVGDWKNHFSEAQSRMMDAEFEKRLAGTKLGAKLKYDLYCK